jgi:hypothetical protein
MADYVIDVISNKEKQDYIQYGQMAINSLRNKINELQQMIINKSSMPTLNQPYQVAFYIKDAIGIPNRASQSGLTNGAPNESYYIRFIPIKKQDVVIDLRTSDHVRGEEWSDRHDDTTHPNIRATAIVQDTSDTVPKVKPQKPHKANGCKIKRTIQYIPTKLYGTPEQVINHLNTLICLFQNGKFGTYKNKAVVPPTTETESKQYTNMNKKLIRLTESDLHRIVKESVNRILSEIDLIPNQSGGMRIADLKEFDFYIGNTRAGSDVVASNEGIFVDDELVNTYDPNVVINEPHDLIEAIDDAISFCPSKYIRKRDRDELGCYLGASLSIKDWWKENYG